MTSKQLDDMIAKVLPPFPAYRDALRRRRRIFGQANPMFVDHEGALVEAFTNSKSPQSIQSHPDDKVYFEFNIDYSRLNYSYASALGKGYANVNLVDKSVKPTIKKMLKSPDSDENKSPPDFYRNDKPLDTGVIFMEWKFNKILLAPLRRPSAIRLKLLEIDQAGPPLRIRTAPRKPSSYCKKREISENKVKGSEHPVKVCKISSKGKDLFKYKPLVLG